MTAEGVTTPVVHVYDNDIALVWRVKDASKLRREHNIAAAPTGTLPHHSTQNQFLGPPFRLLPEQVTYLLERDAIRLRNGKLYRPMTVELRQRLQTNRLESVALQLQDMDGRRQRHLLQQKQGQQEQGHLPEKRAKLMNDDAGEDVAAGGLAEDSGTVADTACGVVAPASINDQVLQQGDSCQQQAAKDSTCSTDGASSDNAKPFLWYKLLTLLPFPWASPKRVDVLTPARDIRSTLNDTGDLSMSSRWELQLAAVRVVIPTHPAADAAAADVDVDVDCDGVDDDNDNHAAFDAAALWRFPHDDQPKQQQRYAVFSDLMSRGYFVTSALKFGGGFLVYRGDPHRYHAEYIAVVVANTQHLRPSDIVSFGRLGTVVKKTTLLCSVDDRGKVHFLSLGWTGAK